MRASKVSDDYDLTCDNGIDAAMERLAPFVVYPSLLVLAMLELRETLLTYTSSQAHRERLLRRLKEGRRPQATNTGASRFHTHNCSCRAHTCRALLHTIPFSVHLQLLLQCTVMFQQHRPEGDRVRV